MAASKALVPFSVVLILASVVGISDAFDFRVGGSKGFWKAPSSPDEYAKWVKKLRFLIGDALVLKYEAKKDSVLQVTEESYNSCNKSDPIKSYDDGETRIALDRSGPFFFISGAEGHCEKGQKLAIRVLSAKRGMHVHPPAPAPGEEPLNHAPAPAPSANGGPRLAGGLLGGATVIVVLGFCMG